MKALTLRNFPPDLARAIQRRAAETGTSLSKVVLAMLGELIAERSPDRARRRYHDLDHLAGGWTKEEGARFHRALGSQRQIDRELWK